MFWGGPGASPLPVSPDARLITFNFTAPITTSKGTMHFRFGNKPGEIDLDDIEVRDLHTNGPTLPRNDFEGGATSLKSEWRFWPVDAQTL